MLTLEQIKNVTFTKAHGAYKVTEVDDFIDQCVDTVATLIEERNTSNKKLQVLADKLVEYRNDEDSIRSALVNAQRLGDTVVREANQKAALTLEDAQIKAEKILEDANQRAQEAVDSVSAQIAAEKEELARVQHEVTLFKERLLAIYKEHLSLVNLLPEEPQPEPEVEPIAEEAPVEEPVAEEPTAAPEEPEQVPVEQPAEEAPVEEPEQTSLGDIAAEAAPTEQEPVEDVHTSRFSALKFGDDYVLADDDDDEEDKPSRGLFRRKK